MAWDYNWPPLGPCPNCKIGIGVWAEPPPERRMFRSRIEIVCDTCGAACEGLRTIEQCAHSWNFNRSATSPFTLAWRKQRNDAALARLRSEGIL